MENALPRRTAGIPRTWSLCMTSENHGTVGKAGDQFSHAPGKHERVQVVEIVAAGSPPAPGVDLSGLMRFGFCDINDDELVERPDGAYFLAHQVEERVTSAPAAKPVGEFKGYVDGQPAATWFDRDNMPRVGTKLYAAPVAAQAGQVAAADLSEKQLDRIARNYFSEQWAVQHAKDAIHDALTESSAAGQVAVPEWQPIETAPQTGCTLLLGCFNELGNWRTMRGQWFTKNEIDQDWEETDGFEAGWYETAVEPDYPNCWSITPTYWMPLPVAPSPAKESK